jgi:Lar family restriction alleviation protein
MKMMPCPFCATYDVEVERTKSDGWRSQGFDLYEVCCSDCDIVGPVAGSEQEAVDRWNNRKSASQGRLWTEGRSKKRKFR